MILVEEYENDFVKGDLKFNLKPKYVLSYYEGTYQGIEFEIVDGDGVYPTIGWMDDNSKFELLSELEDEIIRNFIKEKY